MNSDDNGESSRYDSWYGIDYDGDGKLTSEDDTLIHRRLVEERNEMLRRSEEEESFPSGGDISVGSGLVLIAGSLFLFYAMFKFYKHFLLLLLAVIIITVITFFAVIQIEKNRHQSD